MLGQPAPGPPHRPVLPWQRPGGNANVAIRRRRCTSRGGATGPPGECRDGRCAAAPDTRGDRPTPSRSSGPVNRVAPGAMPARCRGVPARCRGGGVPGRCRGDDVPARCRGGGVLARCRREGTRRRCRWGRTPRSRRLRTRISGFTTACGARPEYRPPRAGECGIHHRRRRRAGAMRRNHGGDAQPRRRRAATAATRNHGSDARRQRRAIRATTPRRIARWLAPTRS